MSRQRFLLIVACFLVLSLLVAPFVSFEQDVRQYWMPWQAATADLRPWNAYAVDGCNYPPVILYVLSIVEAMRTALQSGGTSRVNVLLLKLPSFAAQLVGAVCLFRSLRGELGTRRALAIAAAWLTSLALFVNAAMWCQWDAILSLFMLLALLALRSGRPIATGAWTAVALATKVQAIFALPALGLYFIATRNVRAALLASAGAAVALVLCFAPMAIHGRLHDSMRIYVESVDTFPRRSINAWNPYEIVNTLEMRDVSNFRQKAKLASDSRPVAPGITRCFTYKHLGLLLFGSYVCAMLVVVWRRRAIADMPTDVIVGVPLCGVAMFLLATQMHERYLAPPAALMTLWLTLGRPYRWHFVYWSVSAALNQAFTLARFGYLGAFNPGGAFDTIGSVAASVNVIAFAHLSWLFFRRRQPLAPDAI